MALCLRGARLGLEDFFVFFAVFAPLLLKDFLEGHFAGRRYDFRLGCEAAVGGIVDDFGDGFDGLRGFIGFGEIGGGDLQRVKEQTCASRVDGVCGDAADDLSDGLLDGAAVLRHGEVECGVVRVALARVGYGAAGAVVVVAK